ncbi:hypothetical protein TrRE_jg8909, partial [Triparma retinervis]
FCNKDCGNASPSIISISPTSSPTTAARLELEGMLGELGIPG